MALSRSRVEGGALFRLFVVLILHHTGLGYGYGFGPTTATTVIGGRRSWQASGPRFFRVIQTPKKQLSDFGRTSTALSPSSLHSSLDLQSDTTRFGRGENHLSAFLEEGDVVSYQTGSWLVDGVLVGDGSPPRIEYCCMDTIQVVWTHNCEHGVLRGHALTKTMIHTTNHHQSHDDLKQEDRPINPQQPFVGLVREDDMVEFGPEQLVARLPGKWIESDDNEAATKFLPLVNLNETDWIILEMIDY